jgi:hypothetical protein
MIWLTTHIALQQKGFSALGLSKMAGVATCRGCFRSRGTVDDTEKWNGPCSGFPQTDQNPRGNNG